MSALSIIMPVRNRENLLLEAVESIRNGGLEDYHLIIVDDASTDTTRDAIRKLLPDTKITTLFLPKQVGPGPARNAGLELAGIGPTSSSAYTQDWILFMDSDDLILPGTLAKLNLDVDADIIQLPNNTVDDGKRRYPLRENQHLLIQNPHIPASGQAQGREKATSEAASVPGPRAGAEPPFFLTTAWAHLYRLSFLKANHLRFPALDFSEDVVFNLGAYRLAERIVQSQVPIYEYRLRHAPDSINSQTDAQLLKTRKQEAIAAVQNLPDPGFLSWAKQDRLRAWSA
ncbi:MAG: glycosyltransferase family 2 protein [Propionibacteriaceae bacterium]|jgi:glycosyltransferase involved in cell wall biosynthesis|nr:glycosyltransferase family 2 protein [Propionibacteriaceae bacterium]